VNHVEWLSNSPLKKWNSWVPDEVKRACIEKQQCCLLCCVDKEKVERRLKLLEGFGIVHSISWWHSRQNSWCPVDHISLALIVTSSCLANMMQSVTSMAALYNRFACFLSQGNPERRWFCVVWGYDIFPLFEHLTNCSCCRNLAWWRSDETSVLQLWSPLSTLCSTQSYTVVFATRPFHKRNDLSIFCTVSYY